jgi:hypothetical protein
MALLFYDGIHTPVVRKRRGTWKLAVGDFVVR